MYRHDKDGAAEVGPSAEEVEVGDFLVGVFFGDLGLDELVLCQHVWVIGVTMGVQLGECLETIVCPIMVAEPSVRYRQSCTFFLPRFS